MPVHHVAIALSGGMDSAVAAALLLEKGYDLRAYYMQLPLPDAAEKASQAEAVARALAIPLARLDLRRDFDSRVVQYFTSTYRRGFTPNPCMLCNQVIKFGLLAEAMRQRGAEAIATGHYARINETPSGPRLARGTDSGKDQSYFLARLRQEQLQQVIFPLASWCKSAVRERVRSLGLPISAGESQDVCFLEQGLAAFLASQGFTDSEGAIISTEGKKLGMHQGIWRYTIGQRRGLALPDHTPWYVTAIDAEKNQLIVGKKTDLFQESCMVHALQWSGPPPALPWRGLVQLRSQHRGADAELALCGPDTGMIRFASPQRAITPGQFAVFYDHDMVLGSAVIGATSAPDQQEP